MQPELLAGAELQPTRIGVAEVIPQIYERDIFLLLQIRNALMPLTPSTSVHFSSETTTDTDGRKRDVLIEYESQRDRAYFHAAVSLAVAKVAELRDRDARNPEFWGGTKYDHPPVSLFVANQATRDSDLMDYLQSQIRPGSELFKNADKLLTQDFTPTP